MANLKIKDTKIILNELPVRLIVSIPTADATWTIDYDNRRT